MPRFATVAVCRLSGQTADLGPAPSRLFQDKMRRLDKPIAAMNDATKTMGAIAFVTGGAAAAFALAACCAIPFLLAGLGIGAAWLGPVASAAEPHANALTGLSAMALFGSVGVVSRAPKHCDPGAICARPWFRWINIPLAFLGAILLVLSKIYG